MSRPKWEPTDLDEVRRLASQGLSRDQIAAALGTSRDTIFERIKDNSDFSDALRKGALKESRLFRMPCFKPRWMATSLHRYFS